MNNSETTQEKEFRDRYEKEKIRLEKIIEDWDKSRKKPSNGKDTASVAPDIDSSEAIPFKTSEVENLRILKNVFHQGLKKCLNRKKSPETKDDLLGVIVSFTQGGIRSILQPGPQRGGDFLNNQLRGAWAEDVVCSLSTSGGPLMFIKFGPSMAAMPGQENHAAIVKSFREIMLVEGKRPDLLVYKTSDWNSFDDRQKELAADWPERLLGPEDDALLQKAFACAEVKTSLWHAQKRRLVNDKPLSITAKVEEIKGLEEWYSKYKIPIIFVQVLVDEMYCMSFSRMLEVIQKSDSEKRYLHQPGDYQIVHQRKSGKNVHQFTLYDCYKCADVEMPNVSESKAHVEVLPDGSVIPYIELLPARATKLNSEVILREIYFSDI